MSVQTGEGFIRVDSDDLQFSYRGKKIAIKVREIMWPVVLGCVQKDDGSWEVQADLTEDLFGSDIAGATDVVAYWIKYHGGAVNFIKAVILPLLNKWLAALFPVSDTPIPPLEQLQAAMGLIKFVPQPDGTLRAEVI